MARALLTAVVVLMALPAAAQQLSLQIRDGQVSMTATNVPVRQVLAEWARVGGTRVVGAERIAGQPLTLTLENVPEAKALDIILRGAAGYMAATRAVPGSGSSHYDRILVLATSTPPAASAAAARPGGRFANTPVQEGPEVIEAPPDAADVPTADPTQNPFAAAFAQPGVAQPFGQPTPFGQPVPFGQPAFGQPVFGQPNQAAPFGQPAGATPFGVPMTAPNGNGLFVPVPPQQTEPAPGSFFGVQGAPTPGMVQQPPPQPGQPRPRPQG
ncbi:MAG: hypothetical protein AB7U83_00515 [Vicinamibacterales bacterium]